MDNNVPFGLPKAVLQSAEMLRQAFDTESYREGISVGEINAYICADTTISNALSKLNMDLHDARVKSVSPKKGDKK